MQGRRIGAALVLVLASACTLLTLGESSATDAPALVEVGTSTPETDPVGVGLSAWKVGLTVGGMVAAVIMAALKARRGGGALPIPPPEA